MKPNFIFNLFWRDNNSVPHFWPYNQVRLINFTDMVEALCGVHTVEVRRTFVGEHTQLPDPRTWIFSLCITDKCLWSKVLVLQTLFIVRALHVLHTLSLLRKLCRTGYTQAFVPSLSLFSDCSWIGDRNNETCINKPNTFMILRRTLENRYGNTLSAIKKE